MPEIANTVSATAAVVSAIATCITAAGIWYAHRQLETSREISQMQFEDSLAKEYRDLANRLPSKALLGSELYGKAYEEAFDELFHYIDLSNEQVLLRKRGRISKGTWENWRDGIKWNLSLPAFAKAWSEIKAKSNSFQELRNLEKQEFNTDPRSWSGA